MKILRLSLAAFVLALGITACGEITAPDQTDPPVDPASVIGSGIG